MNSEPVAVQEITSFRESLYRFFSDCLLRPPAGSATATWQDAEWRAALLRLLDVPASEFDAGWELIGSDELAAEHARLFLVPATQTCPFESYHRAPRAAAKEGPSGALLATAAGAVRATYRSWGLCPEAETDEVPDHAATELRFMAMLAGIEGRVRSGEAGGPLAPVLRAQADFLDQHILRWFPIWMETVRARARLVFYLSLVDLLARFLRLDRSTLELLLAEQG